MMAHACVWMAGGKGYDGGSHITHSMLAVTGGELQSHQCHETTLLWPPPFLHTLSPPLSLQGGAHPRDLR